MKRFVQRCRDEFSKLSIRVQLISLIVIAQVMAHLLTFAIIMGWLVGGEQESQLEVDAADVFIGVLSTLTPEDSSAIHSAIVRIVAADDRFYLSPSEPDKPIATESISRAFLQHLPSDWQYRTTIYQLPENEFLPGPQLDPLLISSKLWDNSYLIFRPEPNFLIETFSIATTILRVLFIAMPMMLLTIWATTYVTAPVTRLSQDAQAFAQDVNAKPLPLQGSLEVRSAISAFNNMKAQLKQLIDDRACTLASISHDIRTPLTRLRLRLEQVELGDHKERIEHDIDSIDRLTNDALEFLHNEFQVVELTLTNMTALCETVADNMADSGTPVELRTPHRIDAFCDIHLAMRALQNVVDNAVKYAGHATLALVADNANNTVKITIIDTGPGIPENMINTVLKPFNRFEIIVQKGDLPDKGFGLGLAIAKDCMHRQGGSLHLDSNRPHGLIVTLHFPQTNIMQIA